MNSHFFFFLFPLPPFKNGLCPRLVCVRVRGERGARVRTVHTHPPKFVYGVAVSALYPVEQVSISVLPSVFFCVSRCLSVCLPACLPPHPPSLSLSLSVSQFINPSSYISSYLYNICLSLQLFLFSVFF